MSAIKEKAQKRVRDPCIILLDNGSRRAASTLNLRHLAHELALITKKVIHPVSLLHSNKIDRAEIGGVPAQILEPFLIEKLKEGISSFLVVPLFFGQTAAVYEFVPQMVKKIRMDWPQIEVVLAPCLVNLDDESDRSMAQILSRVVRSKIASEELHFPGIALVDHGTPRIAVNKVRNLVCRQLKEELRDEFGPVKAASMERREGAQYDFNDPLLCDLLGEQGYRNHVVLALLFSSPGRHAGAGGDIARICIEAEKQHDGLSVFLADLPSSDSAFLEILATRLNDALSAPPGRDQI